MARDYIDIGSTPANTECFSVGHLLAPAETRIYRDQLQREFPTAILRVRAFPHDFGTYHEVVAYYDTEDEQSVETAYAVESDASPEWDAIARKELEALKKAYFEAT